MKQLDLGSTYQYGGSMPTLGNCELVEVNNDGSFCYNGNDDWGPRIAGSIQIMADYIEGLPFPSAHFDNAAGCCFLEEPTRERMLQAFQEVARVLVPGGFLKVSGCGPARRWYYDVAVEAGFEIWSAARLYTDQEIGERYYATPFYFWKPDPTRSRVHRGIYDRRTPGWKGQVSRG